MLTNGVSEELVIVDYPSLSLGAMTASACAVVRVAIRNSDSFLSSDGMEILTDYRVAVVDVIKESARITAGDVITIRRVGGALNIEGRRILSNESGFPAFSDGSEYVLFLKTGSSQSFELAAGPHSAFRVDRGMVAPLASARRSSAVLLPEFLGEVKGLIAAPPTSDAGAQRN